MSLHMKFLGRWLRLCACSCLPSLLLPASCGIVRLCPQDDIRLRPPLVRAAHSWQVMSWNKNFSQRHDAFFATRAAAGALAICLRNRGLSFAGGLPASPAVVIRPTCRALQRGRRGGRCFQQVRKLHNVPSLRFSTGLTCEGFFQALLR